MTPSLLLAAAALVTIASAALRSALATAWMAREPEPPKGRRDIRTW